MKKRNIVLISLMILSLFCFFVGCNKTDNSETEVTVSKNFIELVIGDTETITANSSDDQQIIWSSENPDIASVNNGVITAHSLGETEIRATAGDSYGSCFVSVIQTEIKTGLSVALNRINIDITVGQSEKYYLVPEIRIDGDIKEDIVPVWESDNPDVATVENGAIKAFKKGQAKIVCRVEKDGEFAQAECTINVVDEIDIQIKNIKNEFYAGDKYKFNISVLVNGNAGTGEIKWKSDDTNVVGFDAEGYMECYDSGKTKVHAIYDTEVYTIDVKVVAVTLVKTPEQLVEALNTKDKGIVFKLGNSINMSEYFSEHEWEDHVADTFNAVLEGNGFSITGLKRLGKGGETSECGFIRVIGADAVIKNVVFDFDYVCYARYQSILANVLIGKISDCYFNVNAKVLSGNSTDKCQLVGSIVEGEDYSDSPEGGIGKFVNCVINIDGSDSDGKSPVTPFTNYGAGYIHNCFIISQQDPIIGYRSGYGKDRFINKNVKNVYYYTNINDFINGVSGQKSVDDTATFEVVEDGIKYDVMSDSWEINKETDTIKLMGNEISDNMFAPRIEVETYESKYGQNKSFSLKSASVLSNRQIKDYAVEYTIINPDGVNVTDKELSGNIFTPASKGIYKVIYKTQSENGFLGCLTCLVNVVPSVNLEAEDSVVIIKAVDTTFQLNVNVKGDENGKCSFVSQEENIATVNDSGLITMAGAGKTYITVTHDETGVNISIPVNCFEEKKEIGSIDQFLEIGKNDKSVYCELTSDINLTSTPWIEKIFENSKEVFYIEELNCGLDGAGHKITYSFNSEDHADADCSGLIRTISNTALVKNVSIKCNATFDKDYQYVLANTNEGEISNSYINVDVLQTDSGSGNWNNVLSLMREHNGILREVIIEDIHKISVSRQRSIPVCHEGSGKILDSAIILTAEPELDSAEIGWTTGVYNQRIKDENLKNVYMYTSVDNFIKGLGKRVSNTTGDYSFTDENIKQYLDWKSSWKISETGIKIFDKNI